MPDARHDPPVLDVEGYLTDAEGELSRCAAEGWYAMGIDAAGAPLPIVLHHEQVRSVLRDRRLSARSFADDMMASGLTRQTTEQFTPLFRRHGDDHRRHRGLLAAAFTPRSVERLRPVTASIASALADQLGRAGGAVDFVTVFAEPLPPEVFAVIFGLPAADAPRLARWAAVIAKAFLPVVSADQVEAIEAVAAEMREWAGALIEARTTDPQDDLVTRLLDAEIDGERLARDDVIATITGFVFAGAETTKRQLTAMMIEFGEHPEQWRRLQHAPDLVANAVEEVLRHRPIVPGLTRVAVEPFDLDGLVLPRAGRLAMSFTTANRDPGAFAEPHTFDVGRAGADAHVTFGWGPHLCLGAGLARVELQESLRALLERFAAPVVVPTGGAEMGIGLAAPDALVLELASR